MERFALIFAACLTALCASAADARRFIISGEDIAAAADSFIKTGGSLYEKILEKSAEEPAPPVQTPAETPPPQTTTTTAQTETPPPTAAPTAQPAPAPAAVISCPENSVPFADCKERSKYDRLVLSWGNGNPRDACPTAGCRCNNGYKITNDGKCVNQYHPNGPYPGQIECANSNKAERYDGEIKRCMCSNNRMLDPDTNECYDWWWRDGKIKLIGLQQSATPAKTPCSAATELSGGTAWSATCRDGFIECELREYYKNKTGPAYEFTWDANSRKCKSVAERECESKGLLWNTSDYYCLDHANDREDCLKQGAKWEALPGGGNKCTCKIGKNYAEWYSKGYGGYSTNWNNAACKCVFRESASRETQEIIYSSADYYLYASECASSWRSHDFCFGNIMTKNNVVDTATPLACE
ncbi:MAG: hypothetical protein LBL46_04835 [Rickettsiales bacterium]|nr:hypothetical protein [Rickettsiales bacterium]